MTPNNENSQADINRVLIDILKERKSSYRWKMFNRIFWLLTLLATVFLVLFAQSNRGNSDKFAPHIAVIPLHGVIAQGTDADAVLITSLLEKAFASPNVQTIFIDANSPGGSPVQSAIIHDTIARLKYEHKKTVVAIASDICASGCYYAISASDKIVVNASSIIGSIGVRLESFDLRGLMEKVGVKQRLLTAGGKKSLFNPFGELKEEDQEHLQRLINQTHKEFIRIVQLNRGDKLDQTNQDLFSGLIWIGSESIDLGLADQLGDLFMTAQDYPVKKLIWYEDDKHFLERFINVIETWVLPSTQASLQLK